MAGSRCLPAGGIRAYSSPVAISSTRLIAWPFANRVVIMSPRCNSAASRINRPSASPLRQTIAAGKNGQRTQRFQAGGGGVDCRRRETCIRFRIARCAAASNSSSRREKSSIGCKGRRKTRRRATASSRARADSTRRRRAAAEPLGDLPQAGQDVVRGGSDQFGRLAGRQRADIRHKVRKRHVHLVADRRNDRNPRGGDRANNDLLVERPKVFQAAAAAGEHEAVDRQRQAISGFDGRSDLRGRPVALHAAWARPTRRPPPSPPEDLEEIVNGGAGGAGHQGDPPHQPRQRPFPLPDRRALRGRAFRAVAARPSSNAPIPFGSICSIISW